MAMVGSRAGGRLYLPSAGHQCVCLLVILTLCCAVLYVLIRHLASAPMRYLTWPDPPDTTSVPFVDFIDPDLSYIRRMFYSGGVAASQEPDFPTRSGTVRDGQLRGYNVTVFQAQRNVHRQDICVPFHVPGNRTLKICVYERAEDQMISSYLQDHGVWEKEQVEGMADLLLREDATSSREMRRVGAFPLKAFQHAEDVNDTHVRHVPVRSSRGSAGKEDEDWDQKLSVVDVGCNIGVYTLAAASLGHPVLAVDPVQSSLQLLDTSLRLAGVRPRVTLLLNALSDLPGPVQVRLNPTNKGGSSVSQNRLNPAREVRSHLPTVWALCLNHLVTLVPSRRLFLKLDIEGWEARVLRCGSDFFQQLDVRYVLMEWLFLRHHHTGANVIDFMIRNGLLPYSDVTKTTFLSPGQYHTWPDNVWWLKR